jgi:uncharacterized membrane protein YgcG
MVKKHQKAITLLIAFGALLLFWVNPQSVFANEINAIDVNVQLQADGSALITEKWDMSIDQGTEVYKGLNLEDVQEISDYTVSMDGQAFTYNDSWNIDDSFDQKAGTYGQNTNELNWGITSYGNHVYTVSYKISNFITQTSTDQMVYWQFINSDLSPAPQAVTVNISSDTQKMNYEDNRIWGFGFEGKVDINDEGVVTAVSSAPLTEENYVTILLRIPNASYPTAFVIADRSFDSFVEQAFEGSSYNYEDYDPNATYEDLQEMDGATGADTSIPTSTKIIFGTIAAGAIGALGAGTFAFGKYLSQQKKYRAYYPSLKEMEKRTDGQYYRQAPTENVFQTYAIMDQLIDSDDDLRQNYITASILYLVKHGYIAIREEEVKGLLRKQDQAIIYIQKADDPDVPAANLLQLMRHVADKNGRVTQSGFAKYVEKNYKQIEVFERELTDYSMHYLQMNGFVAQGIKAKSAKEKTDFDIAQEVADVPYTEKGFELRDNLVKFKNYLKDFSLLNERSTTEVALWDELMIYAGAFGIADEVEAEFKKIYPEYTEVSTYSNVPFFYYAYFGSMMNRSYSDGHTAATAAASSGGGGFSSLGGGGGSFGGGGGGGIR